MQYLIQSDKEFKKSNNLKGLEREADAWLKKHNLSEGKRKKPKKRKPRKERAVIRSYKTYLKSSLWTRRKNNYFQKYGKRCEACDSSSYITLHHAIYRDNYGDEPDEEVFAMCATCHGAFHKWCKLKRDMREETRQFLEDMRSIIK